MAEIEGEVWECRLCGISGMGGRPLVKHLTETHSAQTVHYRLHASKDSPEEAENTIGFYDDAEQLLAVLVQVSVRAADVPMRFGD